MLKNFDSFLNENFIYEEVDAQLKNIDWTTVGVEFTKDKAKMLKMINNLKWEKIEPGKLIAGLPGLNLKGMIKELKIPKPDMYAIGRETFSTDEDPEAAYYILAVQGHYKNGTVRIYAVDGGDMLTVIASVLYPKEEPVMAEAHTGKYADMFNRIQKAALNKYIDKDNSKWAGVTQSDLNMADNGHTATDHNSGSAGSMVYYLPPDHTDLAVTVTEDGVAVYKRLGKTGNVREDVVKSYMEEDSTPIDPIEYFDFDVANETGSPFTDDGNIMESEEIFEGLLGDIFGGFFKKIKQGLLKAMPGGVFKEAEKVLSDYEKSKMEFEQKKLKEKEKIYKARLTARKDPEMQQKAEEIEDRASTAISAIDRAAEAKLDRYNEQFEQLTRGKSDLVVDYVNLRVAQVKEKISMMELELAEKYSNEKAVEKLEKEVEKKKKNREKLQKTVETAVAKKK